MILIVFLQQDFDYSGLYLHFVLHSSMVPVLRRRTFVTTHAIIRWEVGALPVRCELAGLHELEAS